MRIALAGLDSSRPVRVLRHLQTSPRPIVLVTDDLPVSAEVRAVLGPGVRVVSHLRDAIGEVDVVLDFARVAASRRERLSPVLSAGVHVLADKPLTLSAADARRLVETARRNGVRLEADSGYRLAPTSAQRSRARAGPLEIAGPADPNAVAGGLAFYGSHHVQLLDELRPDALDRQCELRADGPDIVVRLGEVALRFLADSTAGFGLRAGGVRHLLVPPPDYLERLIDGFLARCEAGEEAVDQRRIVRPIDLMERIVARVSR